MTDIPREPQFPPPDVVPVRPVEDPLWDVGVTPPLKPELFDGSLHDESLYAQLMTERQSHRRLWGLVATGVLTLSIGGGAALASNAGWFSSHDAATATDESLPPDATTIPLVAETVPATTTILPEIVTTTVQTSITTPETVPATTIPGSFEYGINPGDSLFSIAEKYHVTVAQLLASNPYITNEAEIKAGKNLIIPPSPASASTTTTSTEVESAATDVSTTDLTTTLATEPDAPPIDDDTELTDEQCAQLGGTLVQFPPFDKTNPTPDTPYSRLKADGFNGSQLDKLVNGSTLLADFHLVKVTVGKNECMPTTETATAYIPA